MKKYISLILFLCFIFTTNLVFAEEDNELLESKISNIGLTSNVNVDDNAALTKIINKQEHYSNSKNIKKLQTYFDEKYINFDGFNKEEFLQRVEDSWKLYSNIKYSSKIKSISVDGNYASVEVIETAKGDTKELCETTKQKGVIESVSDTIYYFKKAGKNWKIISDNVLEEKTYLTYGETGDLAMNLHAPRQVKADSDYDVNLDITVPKGYYAVASIQNEMIQLPQTAPKEVFRNIKTNEGLERVIKSNNSGKNEYAIASIGLTKPFIDKENKITIKVVGLAYIMSRVNVISVK